MGAKVVVVRAQALDWNLENSLKLTKIFGNKPTYKGLKLGRAPRNGIAQARGNKPTYKGLKLCLRRWRRWRWGCCNKPTYKGLKLAGEWHLNITQCQ